MVGAPASAVIIGAGLAGTRCAETLRAGGFGGRIVLVGDEPTAPYERPALSKELLAGSRRPDELALRPPGFWAENGIELLLGVGARSIDPEARCVRLADGRSLGWDSLVIATGARARRLPGLSAPAGVHYLRTLADAQALLSDLLAAQRVAVIGAGFVGAEVASTALGLGLEVAVIETAPVPFERALGREVGEILAARYRSKGAQLHLGTGVAGFASRLDGRVRSVILADGTEIACDVVLIGIGTVCKPIATDEYGRTRVASVYACGDIACAWRPRLGRRASSEHWTSAAGQGAVVARSILGQDSPFDEVPYFWSDQFGLRLQHVGDTEGFAAVTLEGDGDVFSARYVDREGRLLAVLLANRPHEVGSVRRELAAA